MIERPSHLAGRGLKYTGKWLAYRRPVAPRGAWIEMIFGVLRDRVGRTSRVRGLKYHLTDEVIEGFPSHRGVRGLKSLVCDARPSAGRTPGAWIEIVAMDKYIAEQASHPRGVRGLK